MLLRGGRWVRFNAPMTLILTNAAIVLPDAVLHGTVHVVGELSPASRQGTPGLPEAVDLDGDYLLPGAVDVHTDNLERQVLPRAGARWPSRSALLAHDAQCAAAGVTTVLDSLCIGDLGFDEDRRAPATTPSPISTRWRPPGC